MAADPVLDTVRAVLDQAAATAAMALAEFRRGLGRSGSMRDVGDRPGQYRLDLAVDAAVLEVLRAAGVGVLSEESGITVGDSPIVVVVDPVDGSTNASRGIPWYACSLCAVDDEGPIAALVVNLATGTRYSAERGRGALRDGEPIAADIHGAALRCARRAQRDSGDTSRLAPVSSARSDRSRHLRGGRRIRRRDDRLHQRQPRSVGLHGSHARAHRSGRGPARRQGSGPGGRSTPQCAAPRWVRAPVLLPSSALAARGAD